MRPLPPVEVVDMRQELQQGNRSIFSRSLQDALQQLQEQSNKNLIYPPARTQYVCFLQLWLCD